MVLLAVGSILAWRGWRGVRVNDHPVCRGCGFDLVGTVTPELRREVCPECGAGLLERGAVQHGQRRRRPWTVGAGCVLMAAGLGLAGLVAASQMVGFDWNTAKPTWLLVREAKWRGRTSDRVLGELMNRRASGTLTSAEYQVLAEHGLKVQADPNVEWEPLWGHLITDAHDRGELSEEAWETFVFSSVEFRIDTRPRISQRPQVPYQLIIKEVRGAGPGAGPYGLTTALREVRLRGPGGREHIQENHGSMSTHFANHAQLGSAAWLGQAPLEPGRWNMDLALSIELHGAKREIVSSHTLEVLPPGELSVALRPGSEPACRAAANLTLMEFRRSTMHPNPKLERPIALSIAVRRPEGLKYDMAFRCVGVALAEDGSETEWPLGTMHLRGSANSAMTWATVPGDFSPRRMRVRLIGDPAAAEASVDITKIWGGELVVEDVEIMESQSVRFPEVP